ncbi:xanthine/uracil permease [Beijerinckia sp. GAS462]|nr:xanthine/uracil permease [Beijerinckia sp. GAS462]SEB72044.1 hypothetical protein SAMN05443249_0979 [Beijerinckia sp. 28-YEA-48]
MSSWLSVVLGLLVGLVVVGGALYWAFRPPKDEAKSVFPPTRDPGISFEPGVSYDPGNDVTPSHN